MTTILRRARRPFLRAIAGVVLLWAIAWFALFSDLPPVRAVEERSVRATTQILDRNGLVLYEVMDPNAGKQFDLSLDAIPPACINATLATEDRRFYSHFGVDPIAVVRALYQNLRADGDIVSGGSTITQQVARTLLLGPDERYTQSLRRKLREAWLAFKLEARYTKDEILALYLNQTYYGNFAFGMEAAAQVFFGKPAAQMSQGECALLAGLVQYPTGYNPLVEPDYAKARQLTVLRLMREAGFIDATQQAAIGAEPLRYRSRLFDIQAPHFVMYVQDLLYRKLGAERLREGGLRVTTTLDLGLQHTAENAVDYRLDLLNCRRPGLCTPTTDPNRRVDNAAAVVLDSRTGDILSMIGSPDYFDASIQGNVNAALSLRQPGSAIKPLTYAAALDPAWSATAGVDALTPATIIADLPTTFYVTNVDGSRVPYTPVNYDRRAHGPVSVREALANSFNVPAVKVMDRLGVGTLKRIAGEAGITTFTGDFGLALTLGGGEVRLLELTAAYGMLDDGRRLDPRALLSIEQLHGSDAPETIFAAPMASPGPQVIEPQSAWLLTDILDDDIARIPAFGGNSVLSLPFAAAAKTGTTTDWRDNWTLGYSTARVVGVWVGNADNAPMLDVSGIDGAGPIWRDIMRAAHATDPPPFTRPAGIVDETICAPSGMLATPDCPRTRTEHFRAGSQPTQADTQFRRIAIDRATGLRATAETPPQRVAERVYWDLPAQYRDWMTGQGIALIPPSQTADARPTAARAHDVGATPSTAVDSPLVLRDPTSNTAYRIYPGMARAHQRIAVGGYVADGDPWASLRLVAEGPTGRLVIAESSESANISGWWALNTGSWHFRLEGQRTSTSPWELSSPALVVVEEYAHTAEQVAQQVDAGAAQSRIIAAFSLRSIGELQQYVVHIVPGGNLMRHSSARVTTPYSTLTSRLFVWTLVLSMLLSAMPTPAFAQTAPADPFSVPPALVSVAPQSGQSWRGETVTWTYDRPAGIAGYTVTPNIAGEWAVNDTVVTFAPGATPEPGVRYNFRYDLSPGGTPENPPPADAPVRQVDLALIGATPLTVTATQPSDGATDIGVEGQIVVSFNHPVVPLTGASAQADLPQPLTIVPALDGTGIWLTTSIYQFTPATGFAGATQYDVTVDPLEAVTGDFMIDPFSFGFTTSEPIVSSVQPEGRSAAPDSVVSMRFSQPMDHTSTEAAFSLTGDVAGAVDGTFAWNELATMLTFTPTANLAFGEGYEIFLDSSAMPASQLGTLRESFDSYFSVVPLPSVVRTNPENGADNVLPEQQVNISFASTMSRTTLLDAITISPMLTTTTVYSYYNEWDGQLVLEWNKQANTEYTVTIGGEAEDLYGNTLGDDYALKFKTGDFSSFVRVDLERITQFTPISRTYISLYYRNMDGLETSLYRMPVNEFVNEFNGPNSWNAWQNYDPANSANELVWTRTYTTTDERNETYQRIITLNDSADETQGSPLEPGIYILQTPLPPQPVDPYSGQEPLAYAINIIVISNHGIVVKKSYGGDSLAWITDIQSAAPIGDESVDFLTAGSPSADSTTDADGVARVILPTNPEGQWLPLIATVGRPGDANFAIASSDWNQGIASWDFNVDGGYTLEPWNTLFYTERPIYRPGQTVYWKGIVRKLVDNAYVLPEAGAPITITVTNDRGDIVHQQLVNFNENGTVNGAFELAPDATSGYYYILATYYLSERQIINGGTGFQVASYRKPEFELSVTPSQAEYVQGETISVTVQADYFSGGPLGDAPLTWRVIAQPYYFYWDDAPDGRWYSFEPFDPEQEKFDPYAGSFFSGLVKEGEGKTNADGSFTLALPADLAGARQSQLWTIDVTVQSPTNQFVNGFTAVPVHRGDFYIGLSPQSYVNEVGSPSVIDLVTIAPDGKPVGGVDLDVTAYEYRWNSVQEKGADGRFAWTTSVERVPASTERVRTNQQGQATFTWTPTKSGQYQIVAQGVDGAGNDMSSAVFTWVSDPDPSAVASWRRDNNDRIELIADKRTYAPGDTARILVPNPFEGDVTALITYERAGVEEQRVETLRGSSRTLEVPITVAEIPNFFVSVVLVKGIDVTNPTPAIRVGLVQLNVDTAAKALAIDVTTSAGAEEPVAAPGEVVTWTLTVRDETGAPVPNAEVSVALIDKALLSLVSMGDQSLLEFFWRQRPLGVTTGATLIINRDRISRQLSDGAKGGGGGDGSAIDVREDFPDTAYWRADLMSDADGLIKFAVELPDNLTTWRLTARAVTDKTLVGDKTFDLVATKDLQVRPLLPRFFTAGDRSRIGAAVINTSEQDATGTFTLRVEGATFDGNATQPLNLAAGAATAFNFPIAVGSNTDAVTVTMTADGGALTDAVRLVVPVKRYQTPEVVGSSGQLDGTSAFESILVPSEATNDGELLVQVEPSLAAGLLDSLSYLEHYPYECNEQTASRFLPNIFTVRALRALGVDNRALETRLAYQLGVGVQRLVNTQNTDGGWGYWPNEESTPFVTAYILWGLGNAATMDFAVPESVMDRAIDYLNLQFVAPGSVATADNWRLNEMAFMHFVLAEMGDADPGRMSTLYDVRERLDNYGLAYLAMALFDEDPADQRIATLMDDLAGAASTSATGAWWQEASADWQTLNTDIRSTAVILEAFTRIQPENPLLPNVVRWLMQARAAGTWSSTQENAWSIISLTDWMAATGELEANYAWDVTLNDAAMGSGVVDSTNLGAPIMLRTAVADMLRDEANTLHLSRDNDSGQMYYTEHLQYFLDALAVPPASRGIVVDRQFSVNGEPANTARVGDIISVTVTVVAPTSLFQMRVDTPIPAGAEVIDPNLANSPQYDEYGNLIQAWNWDAWNPTYKDYRDDGVSLFESYLAAGTYQYTFQVRATVPGEYRVLPAYAEMMYFTEVWGRSSGELFTITE